ncbi:glycosyltransferase family 4 protein [Clostridium thermobutyricum]|uniref:glycosyltransferase family 4 protein n=1 Tax=Clostridium thermobutyricum TaxID=29372 RepID=UPI0018A9DBF9|nr:glycosyltransferase family 4 protein [Clostridium thermobutyricum]
MENKILIYKDVNEIKPVGGPNGYIYNLKYEIDKQNINKYEFIEKKSNHKYKKIYNKLPIQLKKLYRENRILKNSIKILDNSEKTSNIDFNKYSIIHFHSTFDLYKVKDSLKGYNGKILLTSHCPKPEHLEIIEDRISKKSYNKNNNIYDNLYKIDEFSFFRADYIIFPCKEAEEPYLNRWNKYEYIKNKNKDKYKYLLSGIIKAKVKKSKKEILDIYKIPENAKIISYVGRHNETKGYDILKKIGEKILDKYDNIYFLIAGEESPIKGLEHERWIEVGWTKDPHSIINASDIFVLPNKETYFDLIMLEVISLGKFILASNTGGNKHFKAYEESGILLYDGLGDAIEKLDNLIRDSENTKEKGKINSLLFEKNFSSKIFFQNYDKLIDELIKDKE